MSLLHRADEWVLKGISGYIYGLYLKKTFGVNEYRHWIKEVKDLVLTVGLGAIQCFWYNANFAILVSILNFHYNFPFYCCLQTGFLSNLSSFPIVSKQHKCSLLLYFDPL